jgi:transketolase
MRNIFFDILKEYMRQDETIFLVTADMGLGLLDSFQKEFPERFLNVGIAEQNMVGICAGLCNLGFKPFCYTISNFLIQRCYEQIRNDACMHKYPISFVGTSTGFDNGLLGATHQVLDDIGCLKVLPNISIYSPSTNNVIKPIITEIVSGKGPAYLRIGKSGVGLLTNDNSINFFAAEKPVADTLLVTHGTTLKNCMDAAENMDNTDVYCMNKIKPLDDGLLGVLGRKYKNIIVVEDHFGSSGLYNSICQKLFENRFQDKNIYSLSPPDNYEEVVGNSDYFADKFGYSSEKIKEFILNL